MNKQIKPFRVLLFFIVVFAALALISLFFPPDGIKPGANFHLHFPSTGNILRPEPPQYADISHILDIYENGYQDTGRVARQTTGEGREDILPASDETSDKDEGLLSEITDSGSVSVPADQSMLRELILPLQLPAGNDTVLDNFYRALFEAETEGKPLRIIHYGDSQIENNRISSTLRNRLQSRFGGSGTGMFPVLSPAPHSASIRVITEGNWTRHTPLGISRRNGGHNRYGLLLSYSIVEPPGNQVTESSFSIRPTGIGSSLSRRMDQLTVFFGYGNSPFSMDIISEGRRIDSEHFSASDSLYYRKWGLPYGTAEYSVSFIGKESPLVFSISLDNPNGVAVDNVPLRGSSGLEFAATDSILMAQMMDILNVRLLLLQFGVNVVPHIVDDYTYYENALLGQINYLKSIDPGICIIVIGVSDMSRRSAGGYFESYPNIELIRDAQRNAAFRAGVAFWDLYAAMGGRNSMPSWVEADPPLAQTDYIHFTFRGSAVTGDLLYNAIIDRYNGYTGQNGQ